MTSGLGQPDSLTRFVLERARVRGELVHLDQTWIEVRERHPYPAVLRGALGELMAACALLAATIKFEGGALVLQIQGGSPVNLVVVECQSDLTMRATAKWEGDLAWLPKQMTLRGLAAGGRCALTIDPGPGRSAYQSVVPLEGATTALVLERYTTQSEQIETRFLLAADDRCATGILLQRLPELGGHAEHPDADPELWARSQQVLSQVTRDELLTEGSDDLLRRLFQHEPLRIFETLPVRFSCRCSRERVASVLRMVGADETRAVLAEQGQVSVACEFCGQQFSFDSEQAEAALADAEAGTPPLALGGEPETS